MPDSTLDVPAVAKALGVPPSIVYRHLDEFPKGLVWRVGSRGPIRFDAARLEQWRDAGGSLAGVAK